MGMMLLGLVVSGLFEIAILYFKPEYYSIGFSRLTSYISIGLFILYIIYDTNKIIENAKDCINANYIEQSINLFLDTLNIFTSLVRLERE
jgi:FtsH-binding integral membrane protein